ncbi:hypothetical protein [Paracoccus spongiarum]|uniref:Secreted protein n=1 Tax=Paracoccus spongiarum TaxID=3064387 RepID=A0ABT9J799_9RHOB|nr:hypothetical protein [Paracoccus sp. 2205BS29-5]MDP5305680.1 hypothetical protein [Paracoccus sp. 2205BS29-5]
MVRTGLCWAAALLLLAATPALSDTAKARCDIYPAGQDALQSTGDCDFSQRQGFVTITLADGTAYDLEPVGDAPGNFRDAQGHAAYRQSGLGDLGQIFRLKDISIFVYWARDAAQGDAENATAPFSTDEFDATALLRCKPAGAAAFGQCPAGVMRMEDQQASVTVLDPEGQQFTMNFMNDMATGEPYVNATGREVVAVKEGESWMVTAAGSQTYEVPLVFLTGD